MLNKIKIKVQIEAIKNLIAEKNDGGIDLSASSTNSNVTPHIKVVKTRPIIAK